MVNKRLEVLQWNIRSPRANEHFLERAIDELSPDIICLQETRYRKTENITVSGFECISRFDRMGDSRGGGVAILVSNNVPSTDYKIDMNLEIAAIKVYIPRKDGTPGD